jgi:hypothetical protein
MSKTSSRRSTGKYAPSTIWGLKGKLPPDAKAFNPSLRVTQQTPLPDPYVYQALDGGKGEFRLVTIHAAPNRDDPVFCSVKTVTFSMKPVFETLSYRWGPEDAGKTIFTDGKMLRVRSNLHDALLFLRQKRSLLLWIDAICINQADKVERSQQVGIMPHIYSRASTVLVWLGAQYSKYQSARRPSNHPARRGRSPTARDESLGIPPQNCDASAEGNTAEQDQVNVDMLEELYSDGYWSRVWIVQEIGKADAIMVCYGEVVETWEAFIQNFEARSERFDATVGPIKLNAERKDKYAGAYTFWTLLTTHQDAEASDPRDKVYGLVGLATDVHGFLTDYSLSLYELWRYTIMFCQQHDLVKGDNVVDFARLLKKTLASEALEEAFLASRKVNLNATSHSQSKSRREERSDLERTDQVPEVVSSAIINATETGSDCEDVASKRNRAMQGRIKVKMRIIGPIVHIGPTPSQVVGSPAMLDEWTASLQSNFHWNEGPAHELNDRFIKRLLTLTRADLRDVSAIAHVWEFQRLSKDERLGLDSSCTRERVRASIGASERSRSNSTSRTSSPEPLKAGKQAHSEVDSTTDKFQETYVSSSDDDFSHVVRTEIQRRESSRSLRSDGSSDGELFWRGMDQFFSGREVFAEFALPNTYYQSRVSFETQAASIRHSRNAWDEPRLFQLGTSLMSNMMGMGFSESDDAVDEASKMLTKRMSPMAWKIGVAPVVAKIKDLLCQVHGVKSTFVMRKQGDHIRFIGTAVFADDLVQSKDQEEAPTGPLSLLDMLGFDDNIQKERGAKAALHLLSETMEFCGPVFGHMGSLILYMDPDVLFTLLR